MSEGNAYAPLSYVVNSCWMKASQEVIRFYYVGGHGNIPSSGWLIFGQCMSNWKEFGGRLRTRISVRTKRAGDRVGCDCVILVAHVTGDSPVRVSLCGPGASKEDFELIRRWAGLNGRKVHPPARTSPALPRRDHPRLRSIPFGYGQCLGAGELSRGGGCRPTPGTAPLPHFPPNVKVDFGGNRPETMKCTFLEFNTVSKSTGTTEFRTQFRLITNKYNYALFRAFVVRSRKSKVNHFVQDRGPPRNIPGRTYHHISIRNGPSRPQ